MHSNVLPMTRRTTAPTRVLVVPHKTVVPARELLQTLSDLIRHEHFTNNVTFSRMAKAMKISPGTVSKMMHRESNFPRLSTVTMMLIYFDYDLVAIKKGIKL